MLDRVSSADPDAAPRTWLEHLQRGRQRVDGRDELGVRERLPGPGNRDRVSRALPAVVQMIDRPHLSS